MILNNNDNNNNGDDDDDDKKKCSNIILYSAISKSLMALYNVLEQSQ